MFFWSYFPLGFYKAQVSGLVFVFPHRLMELLLFFGCLLCVLLTPHYSPFAVPEPSLSARVQSPAESTLLH